MDENATPVNETRRLGHDVATTSHEALPADRIDQISTVTDEIATALENDATTTAATGLLNFWAGHVAGDLGIETELTDIEPSETLFEEGFESGDLGVDLYQALAKTTRAADNETNGPDLSGWTDRLFELTNRHVAHLESHQ